MAPPACGGDPLSGTFLDFRANRRAVWRLAATFLPDDFLVKQSFLNHAINEAGGEPAGEHEMSNIANQLVAVGATLLGFVAHDALTERGAPATVVASATEASVDPIVTRSVNLEGLSIDWLAETPRAERAAQLRPVISVSAATIAARPDPRRANAVLAGIRINHVRVAAPGIRGGAFIR